MATANEGLVFDLSTRAKLRLTGADRLRYLNGQISNDLRKATEEDAVHACVLSAKGKIDAEVFVAAEGEAFLLDTEREAGEALAARLERYIIADDVQVEDVTEAFALFHVLGAEAPDLSVNGERQRASRFGEVGTDLWLAAADHERALQELSQAHSFCDEECAETLRIERGLPRGGRELTGEIIPTEANLEASAIDYAKGCYIGQEVISRIKMSGQTNKRLCGFVVAGEGRLEPGMRLVTPEAGKEVGWLTSVAASARLGREIALGFAKRGFQETGMRLQAVAPGSASGVMVEIVGLPFA
ncbi:MAG: glycine cleavage T C-terminal barrel domain-containing protein [Chthoniobacterales bacterium]